MYSVRLCRIDVQSVQWFCENKASSLIKVSISFGVSQVLQVLAVLLLSSLLHWRDVITSLSCQEFLEDLLALLDLYTQVNHTDKTIMFFFFH